MKPMKLYVWWVDVDNSPGTVFVIAPDEWQARKLAEAEERDLVLADGTLFKNVAPHRVVDLMAAETYVEIAGG